MADVQISVRLGRKTRVDAAAILVGLQIFEDDVADEIGLDGCGARSNSGPGIIFWRSHE
jgi:hypothetical protein